MKKKINLLKNTTRTRTPDVKKPRKIRIETINDESNSIYYDILTPKYSQRNEQDLEMLLKEIEFYKMQVKAEKNINKSLNKEISYFNEIQKLGENKTRDFKLLEEITLLDKKNKFLEEYVFKLKNALDKANVLFPNFLEQLQKGNNNINNNEDKIIKKNNENNINKICLTKENDIENRNGIEMKNLIEENKKLNNRIRDLNNEIDKLRYMKEGPKINESILTNKMDDCLRNNNRIIEENKKLKEYINKIDELQNNNENYLFEINRLNEIIKQKELFDNIKKNNINGIENNIETDYKNENIKLIEKNKELEEIKIKNEENIFELISLIQKAEEKLNILDGFNKNANDKIKLLNIQIKSDEKKIEELTNKIKNYEKNKIIDNNNEEKNKIIVSELNDKIKSEEEKINQLEIKNNGLLIKIKEMNEDNINNMKNKDKIINIYENKIKKLIEAYFPIENNVEKKGDKEKNILDNIDIIIQKNDIINKTIIDINQRNLILLEEKKSLNEIISQRSNELSNLLEKNKNLENQINELNNKLNEEIKKNSIKEKENSKINKEAESKNVDKIIKLNKQILDLQKNLMEVKNEKDKEIESLNKKIKDMNNNMNNIKVVNQKTNQQKNFNDETNMKQIKK